MPFLYYNKLHQKNQDKFSKFVLTAQKSFYIIVVVQLREGCRTKRFAHFSEE